MEWLDCIKDLKGKKVITCHGNEGVIDGFDMREDLYKKPVGKYKVNFSPVTVGWYTWSELTLAL